MIQEKWEMQSGWKAGAGEGQTVQDSQAIVGILTFTLSGTETVDLMCHHLLYVFR